ncbi:MAG: hypothetical protein K2M99_03605, partial [Treponemataceae bacterium]|nr:hypothetical protein [Treponemataceae bacterium]
AKPCARAFRAHCGKDFFRCYRSDHNKSDFVFFTAPLRMFFIFSKFVLKQVTPFQLLFLTLP